jgi:hypothetical protein
VPGEILPLPPSRGANTADVLGHQPFFASPEGIFPRIEIHGDAVRVATPFVRRVVHLFAVEAYGNVLFRIDIGAVVLPQETLSMGKRIS